MSIKDGRLVIFSGVAHHITGSETRAHGGFVREVELWARIFREVLVVTRSVPGAGLADDEEYSARNISIYFLPAPAKTDGLSGKLALLFYSPLWIWHAKKVIKSGDVIMARGPDSLGFLGWIVSQLSRHPRFAKYADQWDDFPEEPGGYRLQKLFYRMKSFGGPVMIYGAQDAAHPNWVPFFPSSITEMEWERAGEMIQARRCEGSLRLLFVGRFVYFKGIDVLLNAIKILQDKGCDLILELIGDGPERPSMEKRIDKLGLKNVSMIGWLGPEDLAGHYARAHVFVHPSRKEGYGKVLVEAMAFGLPIVGADVGVSRELVGKNQCGLLFEAGNPDDLAAKLERLLTSPELMDRFAQNGRLVSNTLLSDKLEARYREFVEKNLEIV